jgi:hypothetical protein
MKILFLLCFFILPSAYSATCTNTTRNNYSPNTILTSSALNTDFNQLVTKANAMDGGCITDGTLEASALNSTDFSVVTNGIREGCSLSYVDANTTQVSKCILSVNGNFVKTTTTTNVTWGCSGCSSEVVSTQYYVYAKTGSSGTTLNLLISTTAPGADGYDVSGNKIIGRFYNDSSSAIDRQTVDSRTVNGYSKTDGINYTAGVSNMVEQFSFVFADSAGAAVCATATCSYLAQAGDRVSSVTRSGTGSYSVNLARTYSIIFCTGNFVASGTLNLVPSTMQGVGATNTLSLSTRNPSTNALADALGVIQCQGY